MMIAIIEVINQFDDEHQLRPQYFGVDRKTENISIVRMRNTASIVFTKVNRDQVKLTSSS